MWALTTAGLMKGRSVTIVPVELVDPSPEQRQKGCEIVWQKCQMLEYSVVSIPANADCLVEAVAKGLDLSLLGIQRTGQRVKAKTKRIKHIDRTPDLCKTMELLSLDPAMIADRVLSALQNRGKI